MAHPRWPGFDTHTGNPAFDNMSRRLNTHMYREVARLLRVSAVVPRKVKKRIKRESGGQAIKLWAILYRESIAKLAAEHDDKKEPTRG